MSAEIEIANPIDTLLEPGQKDLRKTLGQRSLKKVRKERQRFAKFVEKRNRQAGEPSIGAEFEKFNGLNQPVRLKGEVAAKEGVETSPYPLSEAGLERIREEFDQPQEWVNPENGQTFTVRILNRGSSDADPLIFTQPYSASPGEVLEHRQGTILRAAYLQEHTMIVVEPPGLGGSDVLTKEQKVDLKQTGSSSELGASLMRAIKRGYSEPLDSVKPIGGSMGGWLAVGVAKAASEMGVPVSGLVTLDAPSFRNISLIRPLATLMMARDFFGETAAFAHVPTTMEDGTRSAIQEIINWPKVKSGASRMWRQRMIGASLGRARLLDDLEYIITKNPELTATIIESSTSKITRPAEAQTRLLLSNIQEKLRQKGEDYGGKKYGNVLYMLLAGANHAIDFDPARAAYLYRIGLIGKAKEKENRP